MAELSAQGHLGLTSREAECQAAAWPGRPASPPLSRREWPRLPGVSHPRGASTCRARAERRRPAGAIRGERSASSPRCERRRTATIARTRSGRKPGLGRLLQLSLPLSRPASCRRRSAYLSLSSETVSRQGRRNERRASTDIRGFATARRRLLAAPQDAGNPYARELELEFSCGIAAERVSLAVSPGDPVRDREPCRASRAPASSGERAGAPCLSAPRAQPPTGSAERLPSRGRSATRRGGSREDSSSPGTAAGTELSGRALSPGGPVYRPSQRVRFGRSPTR